MMARLIQFPQTSAGRALLWEALRSTASADTRLFLATEFDWDESAEELNRMMARRRRRTVR